jgi:hypothetical protein
VACGAMIQETVRRTDLHPVPMPPLVKALGTHSGYRWQPGALAVFLDTTGEYTDSLLASGRR